MIALSKIELAAPLYIATVRYIRPPQLINARREKILIESRGGGQMKMAHLEVSVVQIFDKLDGQAEAKVSPSALQAKKDAGLDTRMFGP